MSNSSRGKVGSRVRFAARSNLPTAPREPPPPLDALVAAAQELVAASLERTTIDKYNSALRLYWRPFLRTYGLAAPPTPRTLVLFIAYVRARGLRTLNGVLSAVSWLYRLQVDSWAGVIGHPLVVAAKAGFKKLHPRKVRRSPPILPHHVLAAARTALAPGATFDDVLFAFMVVVGFGGLLRLAEMTRPDKVAHRDPRKWPARSSVALKRGAAFSFQLPYHKADRFYEGSSVVIIRENSTPDFNFVDTCELFLRRRDETLAGGSSSPFLFARADGQPPSRSFFVQRLSRIDPALRPHGLRAGGTTFLASRGVRPDVIMRLGRWTSAGWTIYLRDDPAVAAAVQRVELAQ